MKMFENRTYRSLHNKKGLVSFEISVKQTNLNIQAKSDLSAMAVRAVLECRNHIENTINAWPEFAASLIPLHYAGPCPRIISDMLNAGRLANVGPMAAVAGAVAEYTGRALLKYSREIVVENGGDIFIKSDTDTIFSIYAKDSPFSMTTGIRVQAQESSYGMCTSSGTLGHSKSLGTADAASVMADSCPLADAAATALGNIIKKPSDIQKAIDTIKSISGIRGIVAIKGDHIGLWGDLQIVRLS